MQENTVLHKKVLNSLTKLKVPGLEIAIEQYGSRLDLPNDQFHLGLKDVGQRKKSLAYMDAVLHAGMVPRVLIEVVDSNPTSPHGITGLTVNVDRIAAIHPNIELLFVVLAEMKDFYCRICDAGHHFSTPIAQSCLQGSLGSSPCDDDFRLLIHEGKAANFKKSLVDYPIAKYLHNISPPSALFLNYSKAHADWENYQRDALRSIEAEIQFLLSSGKRQEARLVGLRELMPQTSIFIPATTTPEGPPTPGTAVVWNSPQGPKHATVKNRGRYNTRITFADGSTEKVPNCELVERH